MKPHEKFQKGIERVFFRGKSTKASAFVTYAIGNVFLMVVLFFFLLNNIAYDWTGQLYPVGSGFRLLIGGIDDAIPFVPEMVIFYRFLFYGIVILTMLYFAFVEYRKGYALGWSLVLINAVAVVIYIIFPVSTYQWRQVLIPQLDLSNFWQAQVYSIYAADTPFNCFPSLHAAVSSICFYAWYEYSKVRPSWDTKIVAVAAFIIAAGVILSTMFIKQHYVVDEIAGIVLALCVGRPLFGRLWKPFKPKDPGRKRNGRKRKGENGEAILRIKFWFRSLSASLRERRESNREISGAVLKDIHEEETLQSLDHHCAGPHDERSRMCSQNIEHYF